MSDGLRLMVYDRTCRGRPLLPGLSHAWGTGAWLYRALGRFDAHYGAGDWADALEWLATVEDSRRIQEIQYWGHGKWGEALIDRKPLDVDALEPGHVLHDKLAAVRGRVLPGGDSLWWFRTCELFGAERGHTFANRWADFFDARVAGHTFIIGHWQSGLHTLAPGQRPGWSASEGIKRGTPAEPLEAHWSASARPHTVTFLHGQVPAGY